MASASASVSACSSSRVEAVPTAVATELTVAGSSRSRRVAVSMSSRWWRTRVATTPTSCWSKPIRAAMSRAMTSPATLWSPGQPLPMSCRRAATRSRSGRWTRRVREEARTAASTRWRSTVQVWTGLRWGRQWTRSQSGSSRVMSPSASSASQTGTVASPAPRRVTSSSRASAGQGTGSGRAAVASAAYDVAGERELGLGGRGRGAQHEDGVAFGAGGAGEDHFAVGLDDALGERGPCRGGCLAAAQHGAQPGAHGPGAQDAVDLAPGDVGGVRDGAGGLVDLAEQGVRVEQAELMRRPGPVPGGRGGRWRGRC